MQLEDTRKARTASESRQEYDIIHHRYSNSLNRPLAPVDHGMSYTLRIVKLAPPLPPLEQTEWGHTLV